jgi:hypothetical protein
MILLDRKLFMIIHLSGRNLIKFSLIFSSFGKVGRPGIKGDGGPGPGHYDSAERKVSFIIF